MSYSKNLDCSSCNCIVLCRGDKHLSDREFGHHHFFFILYCISSDTFIADFSICQWGPSRKEELKTNQLWHVWQRELVMHGKQKLFYVVSHSRKCSGPQNFWYQCTFACSNPLSGVFIILHKRSNLIIGHPVHKKKRYRKPNRKRDEPDMLLGYVPC